MGGVFFASVTEEYIHSLFSMFNIATILYIVTAKN
jgi:hypothetical protein